MAEIKFYGNILGFNGEPTYIDHTIGSGLGFFGAGGFGVSVPVKSQQSSTYITNSSGTVGSVMLRNTAMVTPGNATSLLKGTVKVDNTAVYDLNNLPNNLCPLNIRFTHITPVAVKNCKLRIFDRNNIQNQASGVSTYVYEARHPSISTTATNLIHRADPGPANAKNVWNVFDPVFPNADMLLTDSPGSSGKNTSAGDGSAGTLGWVTQEGSSHLSDRHDWYLALSSEPQEPGAKMQYGLYFSLEYL